MNKLTIEIARRDIGNLKQHQANPKVGLSIREELYLQALEIALPVLEQKDGWISCSDRMPDEREQVILWDADLDEHTSGHYSDQTGHFYNGGMIIDNEITHWMPAPVSPQPPTDTYRQIESDGWIEWGGGDCPVDDCTLVVVVKFRDGETGTRHAGGYRWAHYRKYNDIIAYRVIENDGREG